MQNNNYLKLLLVFLYVCFAAFVYWWIYQKPIIGIDDANIYFVYMRNFAHGYGFVYNPGGERVEGFTSLLWTIIGSVFFKYSSIPEILLLFLNVLLITFTLWQLILFIDKFFEDSRLLSPASYFVLGSVFLIPGYFDWTILALMETGLWSCILITTIINLCSFEMNHSNHRQNNFLFSVKLILMVLTRPESYVWGFAFLVIRFWQLYRLNQKKIALSMVQILIPVICFITTIVGLTVWRIHYFGFPFPNTYYAKISADHYYNLIQGIKYDIQFVKRNFFFLVIVFFAVIYFHHAIKNKIFNKKTFISVIVAVSIFITLLIPLYTGGDHFNLSRFIQPVIPFFYFLFTITITHYYNADVKKAKTYFGISLLLFFIMFTPYYNMIESAANEPGIKNEFNLAENGRFLGNKLSTFFNNCNPMPSIGLSVVGGTAYSYKGTSIDLMGLNNLSMAHADPVKVGIKNHAAFDKQTFYKLAPDISLITNFVQNTANLNSKKNTEGWFNEEWFEKIYKGIFNDTEFRENYFLVFIYKKEDKSCLHTYANKKFLAGLDPAYYSYKIIPY